MNHETKIILKLITVIKRKKNIKATFVGFGW